MCNRAGSTSKTFRTSNHNDLQICLGEVSFQHLMNPYRIIERLKFGFSMVIEP
jgi:hypothetical protein